MPGRINLRVEGAKAIEEHRAQRKRAAGDVDAVALEDRVRVQRAPEQTEPVAEPERPFLVPREHGEDPRVTALLRPLALPCERAI